MSDRPSCFVPSLIPPRRMSSSSSIRGISAARVEGEGGSLASPFRWRRGRLDVTAVDERMVKCEIGNERSTGWA